jgi:hypothetical protein
MVELDPPQEQFFDNISRRVATAASRREALRLFVGALFGGATTLACSSPAEPSCTGCVGSDGKCYTCSGNTVCTTTRTSQSCSNPSAGGVYCCNPAPQSAEAFCASLPTTGYGHFFYCATSQSNLQGGLPNGWLGYCMPADTNSLGLVGYSATTSAGGAFPVRSFSDAQEDCNLINSGGLKQCNSIIRCTRQ